MDRLRQLVLALVGRGGLCEWFRGGGSVGDKVRGGDERDARESSPQPGRRLRGGKVRGRRHIPRFMGMFVVYHAC